jgi:hypothetical protein
MVRIRCETFSTGILSSAIRPAGRALEFIKPGAGAGAGGLERLVANRVHNIIVQRIDKQPPHGLVGRVVLLTQIANEFAQFLACLTVIPTAPSSRSA